MLRRFLQNTTIKEGCILVTSRSTLVHQHTITFPRNHRRSMATLQTLTFDNTALRMLPVDDNASNTVRETPGVVFARVTPTPVDNPQLVSYSNSALALLGLSEREARREEFLQYFSGNRLLPGTEPAAHCYCGHQFGTFTGQLGDGAAVYLGEVVNEKEERWEMQLKGCGKTPYSRTADGRKVLRSSIREYLCSEAMFHLGIPTTRAATCVTSDTMIERDVNYTGDIIEERATVILRIAPTFLRFGSFEIFKQTDAVTGRAGPSVGQTDLLIQLLDYCIHHYYPQIWQSNVEDKTLMYLAFFSEVVKRTAQLVAEWQCVGWCHGVLNTDNMSIVGVTIDYGPYGFIDQYESGFVCNSSDNRGRYAFDCQPDICKWNCRKLAEALESVLPMSQMEDVLQSYDGQYEEFYHHKMMKKFGLMKSYPEDKEIFSTFLTTLEKTGADFTNCFRALSKLPMLGSCLDLADIKSYLLSQCSSAEELQKAAKPRLNPGELQMMMLLAEMDPTILEQFRASTDMIAKELERMKKSKELQGLTEKKKQMQDESLWKDWLNKYVDRLKKEMDGGMTESSQKAAAETRVKLMNTNNPRYILRNYIAQNAIDSAEKGDYSEVNRVLKLLSTPYDDNVTLTTSSKITSSLPGESAMLEEAIPEESKLRTSTGISYDDKPPACSKGFKVSCSS